MVVKAPAKINLGLHIKEKRPDGFHEIESIFYKIPLFDVIELIPSSKDEFYGYGIDINSNPENNLCLRALTLLRYNGFKVNNYAIHLLKNIPIGAGLGGGSSDAAAILKAVNELDNLGLEHKQLSDLSADLGSDCPFFFFEQAAKVSGRGEIINELDFSLKGFYMRLVYPNLHIGSGEAYGAIDLARTTKSSLEIQEDASLFRSSYINDFESGLADKHPVLQRVKTKLYKEGAFYASLTGSGSATYGLFHKKPSKEKEFSGEGYKEWLISV